MYQCIGTMIQRYGHFFEINKFFKKIKKPQTYKPDSVPHRSGASVIYLNHTVARRFCAAYPPCCRT